MSEWINVKDRLPHPNWNSEYLAKDDHGYTYIATYNPEYEHWHDDNDDLIENPIVWWAYILPTPDDKN